MELNRSRILSVIFLASLCSSVCAAETCQDGFCGYACGEACRCYNGDPVRNNRCPNGRCAPGRRGYPGCQEIDCAVNNGGCEQRCFSGSGVSGCGCWDGYILQPDGKSCVEKDSMCLRNKEGREYNGTVNISRSNNFCLPWRENNVTQYDHNYCRNPAEFRDPKPWCFVYTGIYIFHAPCNLMLCSEIDECNVRNCQHRCQVTDGEAQCDCFPGYTLQQGNCNDVDECANDQHQCRDTEQCVNTAGGYYCSCKDGYLLDEDTYRCQDIDECSNRTRYDVNGSCHTCHNTVGGYYCECDDGYSNSSSGKSCLNIDECAERDVYQVSSSCHQCVDLDGSYKCNCFSGYVTAENEQDCIDVDECEDPAVLDASCHICINTPGSYHCDCHNGYEQSTDKRKCLDKDECADPETSSGDYLCPVCVNTNGSFYCECNVGYVSEPSGGYCRPCESGRFGQNCSGQCNCLENAACDHVNGTCPDGQCAAGWTGDSCQQGCPNGTYGPNCRHLCECASSCDQISGVCPTVFGGIEDNNEDDDGDDYEDDDDDDDGYTPTTTILAVVISILALAVIIIGLLILSRRYLNTKADRSSRMARLSLRLWSEEAAPDDSIEDASVSDTVSTETTVGKTAEQIPNKPEIYASENDIVIYSNVQPLPENTWIAADCLEEFVAGFDKDLLSVRNEFEALPPAKDYSRSLGQNPEVATQNRFKNIQPYDYNIVSLGAGSSDSPRYINASWVPSFKGDHKFIASQGPTKHTVGDFWSMIWEHNVCVIAMLTNLLENNKRKCEHYWPDDGEKTHGDITVTILKQDVFPLMVIKNFSIHHSKNPKLSRPVTQFHFTSWPDHCVPSQCTSLIRMCKKVSAARMKDSPTLVHCSAGVGRTGTFIALDWLLQQAEEERRVDVVSCVDKLRDYRMNMIQNVDQYIFLYHAVCEGINLTTSPTPCRLLEETYERKLKEKCLDGSMSQMSKEFMMLNKQLVKTDENAFKTANLPENACLNKTQFLPKEKNRVRLIAPVKGRSDYINAVFVKVYRLQKVFIATNWPMDNTVVDFWRMITDYRISSVVVLQSDEDTEVTPSKENRIMTLPQASVYWQGQSHKPHMSVKTVSVEAVSRNSKHNEAIYMNVGGSGRQVRFFTPALSSSETCHIPIDGLLETRRVIQEWQNENKTSSPILVVCRDGVTFCGWYIATDVLQDMMTHEDELDPFFIVRQLKLIREEFIPTQEMYESLHTSALQYHKLLQSDEQAAGNL